MSWSKVGQGEVVSLPRGGWIPVISSETCFVKMASEIWFRPSFWSPNSCFISARNVSSLQNLPLFIKLLGRGQLPKCHLAKLVKFIKKTKGSQRIFCGSPYLEARGWRGQRPGTRQTPPPSCCPGLCPWHRAACWGSVCGQPQPHHQQLSQRQLLRDRGRECEGTAWLYSSTEAVG